MTVIPPPGDLKHESDRLFSLIYARAIKTQHHIVDTYFLQSQGAKYDLRNHLDAWQTEGLGRLIEEQDSYGQHSIVFALNASGVRYAQSLSDRARRKHFKARLLRNFWTAANALGSMIAAIAAIIAAYFAYVGARH